MEEKKRGKRGSGCIYRINKDSGNWYIKYHVNGKPQYENSGSPDKKLAEKILKERLAKKNSGAIGTRSGKSNVRGYGRRYSQRLQDQRKA